MLFFVFDIGYSLVYIFKLNFIMKISVSSALGKYDALFVFIPEKKWNSKIYGSLLSKETEKTIEEMMKKKYFKGSLGEILELSHDSGRVFLCGTGKGKEKIDMRKAAGVAIRKAKKIESKKVSFLLSDEMDPVRLVSGALLGNYEFKLGDTSKQFSPHSLDIVTHQKIDQPDIDSEIVLAESTNVVRDLVNLPANKMTPPILAEKAKSFGKRQKSVLVKVLGEKEIQKLNMGALYNVGVGSHEESKVIIFEYNGGKKNEKPIAFVGKGVTFDAGGYNIKPTNHIETMKCDMAGAATVFGIFEWIAKAKPKKNIIGIMGAVENLVSGNAYKPGDIITAMNGQTIEITNTDAEGRLVLADCLYYAATKYKPSMMVDIATLTGSAVVALGNEITAIMGNDKKAVDLVKKSAEESDELAWELPLNDFFREKTKGEISDLVNWTAGVSAGSSMGGAFLDNFVEKTPWVHCDIGGTGFHDKSGDELSPKGATGVMMRTFRTLIES